MVLALGVAACEPDAEIPLPGETPAMETPAAETPATEPHAGERVPLELIEGPDGQVIVLIPVFIQGEGPYGFALDTGASVSRGP